MRSGAVAPSRGPYGGVGERVGDLLARSVHEFVNLQGISDGCLMSGGGPACCSTAVVVVERDGVIGDDLRLRRGDVDDDGRAAVRLQHRRVCMKMRS